MRHLIRECRVSLAGRRSGRCFDPRRWLDIGRELEIRTEIVTPIQRQSKTLVDLSKRSTRAHVLSVRLQDLLSKPYGPQREHAERQTQNRLGQVADAREDCSHRKLHF
jgi:hypothetical protein